MKATRVPGLHMLMLLAALVSCVPLAATQSTATPLPATPTTSPFTLTVSQTQPATSTPTVSATATVVPTLSVAPRWTPLFLPSPTPTRRVNRQGSPTPTLALSATGTPPSKTMTATRCPVPTAENFMVEPVTSPTGQLSQIVTVYLGLGEQVTIITESGTFIDTTSPFQVEITLLADTVHHLEVQGKVRQVWVNGCSYGGYTMSTRVDRYGAPLTIEQRSAYP